MAHRQREVVAPYDFTAALLLTTTGCADAKKAGPQEKTFTSSGKKLNVRTNDNPTDLVPADIEDVRVTLWFHEGASLGGSDITWELKGDTLDLDTSCSGLADCDSESPPWTSSPPWASRSARSSPTRSPTERRSRSSADPFPCRRPVRRQGPPPYRPPRRSPAMPTCLAICTTVTSTDPPGTSLPDQRHRSTVIYEDIVRPACEQLGVVFLRADRLTDAGLPRDQLLRMLTEVDFVVADLGGSDGDLSFGLGMRHALGRPTVHATEGAAELQAAGPVTCVPFPPAPRRSRRRAAASD